MGGRAESAGPKARVTYWDPVDLDWSAGRLHKVISLSVPTAAVPSALVSNWEQSARQGHKNSDTAHLQRFTTGSNADGYALSSIGVISEDAEGDSFSATVCPADAQGLPAVAARHGRQRQFLLGAHSARRLLARIAHVHRARGIPSWRRTRRTSWCSRPTSRQCEIRRNGQPCRGRQFRMGWSIANTIFIHASASAYRNTSSGLALAVRIAVRGER